MNSASLNLEKEKAELVDIESQIHNGMRALLGGMYFPELEEELSKLRLRKAELEDIIGVGERENNRVNPADIVKILEEGICSKI